MPGTPSEHTNCSGEVRAVLLLPELPTAGEKLFSEYDQKNKDHRRKQRKWFTRKSCCRPMPHPNMQTEQRSLELLPRK